ncbi:hypothetical protein ACE1CI_02160 [Aerosakkonemataceae cyanobacterium BLCC-F50]|uniref:Uncharacterized protein n=1 Tax=Floridaenema flaviceps BLCC-F50 TaxID=3153642 RepID=A0ABV4XJJ2_9CYAN
MTIKGRETHKMMEVQALPVRYGRDSQPSHDDPTRNSGGRSWQ